MSHEITEENTPTVSRTARSASDGGSITTRPLQKYGRWAVVTGASSGLGEAFAEQLAGHGFNLVLVARREDRLQQLGTRLEESSGIETRTVAVDLSRDCFLEPVANATKDIEVGLLVNNAGRATTGDFLDQGLAVEIGLLNLNVRAPLMLAHHFGRQMRRRGHGGIIFVSSVVGLTGVRRWSNYAATKGHNLLFAEGLGDELQSDGVNVTAITPAFIATDFMALSAFGRALSTRPETVVRSALASLGRKRVVTPGLIHKLIAFSTRLQPRVLNRMVFNEVVSAAGESGREPASRVSRQPANR